MEIDESIPFSRRYRTDRIAREGLRGTIEANAEERSALALLMGLEALDRLSLQFEVKPVARARFRVCGHLEADVTQTCVVTLEPIRTEVAEDVEQDFWPEQDLMEASQKELELSGAPDREEPEPIRDGAIDLGGLAYEWLAAGLDPYPRKPGAAFDWQEDEDVAGAESPSHPFEALRSLKRD